MPDEDDDEEEEDDDDAAAAPDEELSIAIPIGLDVIFSKIRDGELLLPLPLPLMMFSSIELLPLLSRGRLKMQYLP